MFLAEFLSVEYLKWKKPENWKSKENKTVENNCSNKQKSSYRYESPWLTGSKQEINFFKKLVGLILLLEIQV